MIKKIIVFILFFISSCNLPHRESNLHQNYYQKGLKFTLKTAREIEKENNLKLLSYGVNNPGEHNASDHDGIYYFSYTFLKIGKYNIDEVRNIIVRISNKILNSINQDIDIKKYLFEFPFKVQNIKLSILFENEKGDKIYGKNIDTCIFKRGTIVYFIIPDENSTMQTYEESYEDAVNIVKDNLKTDPIFK
jgi:hypothetical protein